MTAIIEASLSFHGIAAVENLYPQNIYWPKLWVKQKFSVHDVYGNESPSYMLMAKSFWVVARIWIQVAQCWYIKYTGKQKVFSEKWKGFRDGLPFSLLKKMHYSSSVHPIPKMENLGMWSVLPLVSQLFWEVRYGRSSLNLIHFSEKFFLLSCLLAFFERMGYVACVYVWTMHAQ